MAAIYKTDITLSIIRTHFYLNPCLYRNTQHSFGAPFPVTPSVVSAPSSITYSAFPSPVTPSVLPHQSLLQNSHPSHSFSAPHSLLQCSFPILSFSAPSQVTPSMFPRQSSLRHPFPMQSLLRSTIPGVSLDEIEPQFLL